jgi:hypothetical protein
MGIHGLTKLLGDNAPKCIKEQAFNNYFGRKIAVDASMHIYQFLAVVGRQGDQLLSNEAGEVTSHLQGMFYRTARMLEAGEQQDAGTCTCSPCQSVCKITAPACSFALHASAPSIALQAAVAAAQWHHQDKQQAACHKLAHTSALHVLCVVVQMTNHMLLLPYTSTLQAAHYQLCVCDAPSHSAPHYTGSIG